MPEPAWLLLLALAFVGSIQLSRTLTRRAEARATAAPAADAACDDAPADATDADVVGEWVHARLMDAYGAERAAWAIDRVRRVEERLQRGRPADARKPVEILWIPEVSALRVAGRYVYVSRRLLERTTSDEPIALAVAHEIAHHDLGHVGQLFEVANELGGVWGRHLAGLLAATVQRQAFGPERELDADAHALDLCLAAGYDAAKCIQLFDILESDALDHGAVEGVFGPASVVDARLNGEAEWKLGLRKWLWERSRGYPSLHERRQALLARAAERTHRSDDAPAAF